MRRRLLLMITMVTGLTVGTILTLTAVVARNAVDASWQSRAVDAARVATAVVAGAHASERPITPESLRVLARPSSEVRVRMPDGEVIQTGEMPEGDYFVASETTDGTVVTTAIPRAEAQSRFRGIMTMVLLCGVAAFALGMAGAWFYSRRLTNPLRDLAHAAERLSTGDRRKVGKRYGIAELDAVAEVIDRGVESFNQVLEAERRLTLDASHQLRTPLTALSLRLEEIIASDDLEMARHEATQALGQVERLAGVSEHLVAVARGARVSGAAPFAVDRLVTAALAEWTPLFAAAGRTIQWEGERGLVVVAVLGAQSQVLATVVENSLRHGGGATTIRSRAAGSWVVVEVRDEGPGVDPVVAPRVFERNVTSDPAHSNGLGLTLARTLAAADGGRLELLSAAPAVFAVFLPTVERGTGQRDGSGTEPAQGEQPAAVPAEPAPAPA